MGLGIIFQSLVLFLANERQRTTCKSKRSGSMSKQVELLKKLLKIKRAYLKYQKRRKISKRLYVQIVHILASFIQYIFPEMKSACYIFKHSISHAMQESSIFRQVLTIFGTKLVKKNFKETQKIVY